MGVAFRQLEALTGCSKSSSSSPDRSSKIPRFLASRSVACTVHAVCQGRRTDGKKKTNHRTELQPKSRLHQLCCGLGNSAKYVNTVYTSRYMYDKDRAERATRNVGLMCSVVRVRNTTHHSLTHSRPFLHHHITESRIKF